MLKSEIRVGGLYVVKMSGMFATVRVDKIRDNTEFGGGCLYDVTNLRTGRRTTFPSAAKFRCEAPADVREEYADLKIAPETAQADPTSEDSGSAPSGGSSEPLNNGRVEKLTEGILAGEWRMPDAPSANTSFAARVASQFNKLVATHQVPDTIAGYTPTAEQRTILETILTVLNSGGPKVLVIEAGAGAGKTSTLKMIEQLLHWLRGQYTAFNKSLVEESRPKFTNAKCNTTHSLAFHPCGRDYQHRLPGRGNPSMPSWQVAQMLGLEDFRVVIGKKPEPDGTTSDVVKILEAKHLAGLLKEALRKFSQTADRELLPEHIGYVGGIDQPAEGRRTYDNNERLREYLMPFLKRMWADVERKDGVLPFQHDYYVKMWQLRDNPIIPADYILLDEDQDTAPVFADVIRRQSSLLVLVGDENQEIYKWRGACNVAKMFPDAPVCYLTQSFRFGQTVADVANSVLGELEEPTKLRMRGVDRPTRVLGLGAGYGEDHRVEYVGKICYLYRTNAGAVGRILAEYEAGRRGHLIGKIDEIVDFAEGALALQSGRRTGHHELAIFETWEEVKKFVKDDPSSADLEQMVKLVETFGTKKIIAALKSMPKEEDADFVSSTAHKSKGREWDTVILGADFPPACSMGDEDTKLLYVASTRAKFVLDLTNCTPFHPYKDKYTGEQTPGIRVTLTVDNPTAQELADWLASKAASSAPVQPPSGPAGGAASMARPDGAAGQPAATAGQSAPARPAAPAPDGEAIRRAVAAATERVVTYTRLQDGEWGMWASAEIKPGEMVEIKTRTGAAKCERVGRIISVQPEKKKWLATIAR